VCRHRFDVPAHEVVMAEDVLHRTLEFPVIHRLSDHAGRDMDAMIGPKSINDLSNGHFASTVE